jgi:hypothetical protein
MPLKRSKYQWWIILDNNTETVLAIWLLKIIGSVMVLLA